MNRRELIAGLISFAAATPAIVRAGSLMPVKMLSFELSFEPCHWIVFSSVASGAITHVERLRITADNEIILFGDLLESVTLIGEIKR